MRRGSEGVSFRLLTLFLQSTGYSVDCFVPGALNTPAKKFHYQSPRVLSRESIPASLRAFDLRVSKMKKTNTQITRQFKVRRSKILTLPRPEEASGAIFPVGSRVMTLYPQTTTFYPATVSGSFVEGRVSKERSHVRMIVFISHVFAKGWWLLHGTLGPR